MSGQAKNAMGLLLWLAINFNLGHASPLVEQVSGARSEVDSLASQLETQRQQIRSTLSALRMERTELQRQIRLEEIRRGTLNQLQAERTRRVEDQEDRIRILLEPVVRAIASTKKYVASTLPFKQGERMRRLEKIEADLAVTHPDPAKALTTVWRFIEEEQAMAKEISLAQQAISFEDRRLLVDVVRIGMALMYFRLPDGGVGWVRQVDRKWRFERIQSAEASKVVLGVFEAMENNRILGPRQLLISADLPPAVNEGVR